jgi:Cu-processing system permease protein
MKQNSDIVSASSTMLLPIKTATQRTPAPRRATVARRRIIRLVLGDLMRHRIVITYALLMGLLSWSVFLLEDTGNKGLLTLLNIVLLVVPLVSILFATIYVYNSAEFVELLLSQPVQRREIWTSLFAGLSLSLTSAYLLAVAPPLLIYAELSAALTLIASGVLTTVIFVSLAFLAAILSRDKAKGVGVAILLWLYFALLFDGLVLFLLFQFSDYPIERLMVALSATSPLDLVRILNLLQLDASAMMGYTGAIFKQYFGNMPGMVLAFGLLLLWAIMPFIWSLRIFRKKDL